MDKREEKCRKQCIALGMGAVLLLGIAVFQQMKELGEERAEAWRWRNTVNWSEDAVKEEVLVLVNKEYQIPDDYTVELHWLSNGSCAVSEIMYDALKQMLTDGSVNGREYVVASGYRDGEKQKELLEEDIERSMAEKGMTWQEAYDFETKETMPPGYSEHETGLAVDIVALDYQILDEAQALTAENIWLRENCSKYGFILRYPKGKEDITGINYEPWHFRYVGVETAQEITRREITLEEYLEEMGVLG